MIDKLPNLIARKQKQQQLKRELKREGK